MPSNGGRPQDLKNNLLRNLAMNKSEQINELATALAKAQSEITFAAKETANGHFKTKYADLAAVWEAIRAPLTRHGLSVTQFPSYDDQLVSVETIMMHSSGQWISSVASSPAVKLDPQGVGSAITYLRRYSLAAVAGVAQDDDDGNAASKNKAEPLDDETVIAAWRKRIKSAADKDAVRAIKDEIYKQCGQTQRVDLWNIIKVDITAKVDLLDADKAAA